VSSPAAVGALPQRVAWWTFAAALAIVLAGLTRGFAHAEQPCVTGFDPPELNLPASMASTGPASFNVLTATPTCHWEFDGGLIPVWVLPLANVSGDGPKTVGFLAPNNPNTTSRSAVLTFGGRPFTITQAGDPCQLTFSPNPVPMPAAGGTGSFTITATGAPCSYSAQPPSGVVIVSGGNGSTFPATVTFSMGPNTTQGVLNHRVAVSVTGQCRPVSARCGNRAERSTHHDGPDGSVGIRYQSTRDGPAVRIPTRADPDHQR
jgi:hypothetical protein